MLGPLKEVFESRGGACVRANNWHIQAKFQCARPEMPLLCPSVCRLDEATKTASGGLMPKAQYDVRKQGARIYLSLKAILGQLLNCGQDAFATQQ